MLTDNRYSIGLWSIVAAVVLHLSFSFAQVSWDHHIIDGYTHGTSSVYACDLDNDNDMDIVAAVLEDDQMVWFRNDGGDTLAWTKFIIASNFLEPYSVYAADLDDDGDQDVIGAAGVGNEVAWWRNDSGDTIQWTKYTIRNNYNFAHEVYAHDLDEDGDMDVFGASTNLNLISWWRNEGGDPIQWTEQTIASNFQGAKSVRVGDIDDDGDNDVAGACLYGNDITWWRNDGGDTIQWTGFTIDSYFGGAHRVQIIDMDDDDDLDILAVAYLDNEIAWYSNEGGDPINWSKQTIGTGFQGACIAQAADLDRDGDLDVAGTAQVSHQVAWWRNDGGNPIVWTKCYIDDYFYRAWPLYVCDLDDDNDDDAAIASSWAGNNVVQWCENLGTAVAEQIEHTMTRSFNPTVLKGPICIPIDMKFKIFDITGQEVNDLDPAPGIYFLQINGKVQQKIIKIQ
jgi:hypothetical protein